MNWILSVPIELRLAVAFVVGACLGAMANWAAVRLAWEPRSVSPWAWDPADASLRWIDRLPIVGWFFLARHRAATAGRAGLGESTDGNSGRDQWSRLYRSGFWIRPFLVELLTGVGVAALYWWEIDQGGILPAGVPRQVLPALAFGMHIQWLCHITLGWLMLAASLIDADEKLIPDEITVPGTLFGLTVVAVGPWALLPVVWPRPHGGGELGFLTLLSPSLSPRAWPAWLDGYPHVGSLAIGLALWWLWLVALMDRPWCTSWGWRWALRLLVVRLTRSPATWRLCRLGLAGTIFIATFWLWTGPSWIALLSGLAGVAGGGGLIWMVRIVAAVVLKREAMGFGDVTLLAMIGALLGWQSCLVIFFLAPLAGVVLGLLQLVLRRENEIPFGPFLCLATVVLIVGWQPIWDWLQLPLLMLGGYVPLVVVICLLAMAVLLGLWRLVAAVVRRISYVFLGH